MNLSNLLTRQKLHKERFSKSVLPRIEDEYHSESKDKSATVEFLLKVFGNIILKMVFFPGFLKE